MLNAWPEHKAFLALRLSDPDELSLTIAEEMAGLVLRIIGADLAVFIAGSCWMCEAFVAEDLHFRSAGGYRLTTFEYAYREV